MYDAYIHAYMHCRLVKDDTNSNIDWYTSTHAHKAKLKIYRIATEKKMYYVKRAF